MWNCALLNIGLSSNIPKETRKFYFLKRTDCLTSEAGVPDRGHQMWCSSWSRESLKSQRLCGMQLCAGENKEKMRDGFSRGGVEGGASVAW